MRLNAFFSLTLLATVICLVGCSSGEKSQAARSDTPLVPPPQTIDPAILTERNFHEAPMLAERVERGELPPVAERLPEDPLVVKPIETIGTYGGELRMALLGDIAQRFYAKALNDNIMKFERPLAKRIVPNLAESYEFKDGNTTLIIHLRKGIRWSDGVPFTVDDYLFWYEDMELDEQARSGPFPPAEWLVDGKPIHMEKVDDLTLRITSPQPLARALFALCHDDTAMPKHYWSKYHPRYNPEENYEDFREFSSMANRFLRPDVPRVSPWFAVQWVRGQRAVYERNPYYWKVDTAGNQLPYADRLVYSVIPDPDSMLLKFNNGEFDFFMQAKPADLASLRAVEAKGVARVNLAGPTTGPVLFLNWSVENPVLREAFHDKRVRMALSYAINREEINEVVYKGLLQPSGFSFFPESVYSSEEALRRYSEYDPAKARALLDEAGYRDTDGDGIRELRDGSPFTLTLDLRVDTEFPDICELVVDYWKAIGIKPFMFPSLQETIYDRWLTGKFEVHASTLDGAAEPLDVPHQWGIWKGNGPLWFRGAADNPPPWITEISERIHVAMTTIDPDQLNTIMGEVSELLTDNIPHIAIGPSYKPWGSNLRLANVPSKIAWDNAYRGPDHSLMLEQVFVKP